jgi:dTDP-4-amino-4,6-dideoxygalactose transaminase
MKRTRADLAVCGGTPAFAEPLHVGRPTVADRERLLRRIGDVLDRGRMTNDGPFTRELEARLAERLGVRHCVATCNGTLALQLAVRALDLRGEVIVPSFTFVATANALAWEGLRPVFCDLRPGTHSIDPAHAAALVTPRTAAIVGVHLWGIPCDVEALAETAARHDLHLLFDAAHAFDCTHRGRPVGGFGDAEIFSFHATKYFHTLEGGAITTNDDALAARLRRLRNHGFTGIDEVAELGTNAKMNEFSAAVGLTLLEDLEGIVAANRANCAHYRRALGGIGGLRLLAYDQQERCNYQFIVAEIDAPTAGVSRDELVDILWAENVRARRYFYPGCHRLAPFLPRDGDAMPSLPETERIAQRVLCLPTGPAVTADDIETIGQVIRLATR